MQQLQRPPEGARSTGAEVTGSCEPLDVSSENCTQAPGRAEAFLTDAPSLQPLEEILTVLRMVIREGGREGLRKKIVCTIVPHM